MSHQLTPEQAAALRMLVDNGGQSGMTSGKVLDGFMRRALYNLGYIRRKDIPSGFTFWSADAITPKGRAALKRYENENGATE